MRAITKLSLGLILLLVGCSSHEEEFERDAPPPPNTRAQAEEYANSAAALIERQARRIVVLSPESLANLAQASSKVFTVTNAPRMRAIARDAAGRLLEARLPVDGGIAFADFAGQPRPDPWLTATAGLALLDVHAVTREPRFLQAIRDAARALVTPSLGWTTVPDGSALDDPGDTRGPDIALTARAALFLAHAEDEAKVPLGTEARSAFRVIGESQPAVGHWYSTTEGPQPQTLSGWSATLLTVVSPLATRELGGIGGAGVPGLWRAVFTPDGRPRSIPLVTDDRAGVPLALMVLQTWPDERYAALAFRRAQEVFEEGSLARYGLSEGQLGASRLALAFAHRAEVTLERSRSK